MATNINIRNPEIVRLINARAIAEGRDATNAANQTIREALEPVYGRHANQDGRNPQAKNRRSFRDGIMEKGE